MAAPTDPAECAATFLFERNMQEFLPEINKSVAASVGTAVSQLLGEQSAIAVQLEKIVASIATLEKVHGARLDALVQAVGDAGAGAAPPVGARVRAPPPVPTAGGAGGAEGAPAPVAAPLDPAKAGSYTTSQNYWKSKFIGFIGVGPESTAEAETLAGAINGILCTRGAADHASLTQADILSVWDNLSKTAAKSKNPAERSAGAANVLIRLLKKEQKDALKREWEERKKAEKIAATGPQLPATT
jgi:hypothetical protein